MILVETLDDNTGEFTKEGITVGIIKLPFNVRLCADGWWRVVYRTRPDHKLNSYSAKSLGGKFSSEIEVKDAIVKYILRKMRLVPSRPLKPKLVKPKRKQVTPSRKRSPDYKAGTRHMWWLLPKYKRRQEEEVKRAKQANKYYPLLKPKEEPVVTDNGPSHANNPV